jgi:hypothetical protein
VAVSSNYRRGSQLTLSPIISLPSIFILLLIVCRRHFLTSRSHSPTTHLGATTSTIPAFRVHYFRSSTPRIHLRVSFLSVLAPPIGLAFPALSFLHHSLDVDVSQNVPRKSVKHQERGIGKVPLCACVRQISFFGPITTQEAEHWMSSNRVDCNKSGGSGRTSYVNVWE